jgi:ribonuclease Z
VDISVHECFATPQILLDKQNYRPEFALTLSAIKHTSPMQFGKEMAMTQPWLAVGYHFFNDHDTLPAIFSDVRKTYDGPLALATDYMVFNVTKKDIRVRMAAIDQAIWPLPPTRPKKTSGSTGDSFSDFIKGGGEWMPETLDRIWNDFNQRNGTDYKVPSK